MLKKPKQIVIDKNAFQGTALYKLRTFTEKHALLVCDTLLYECGTTGSRNAAQALQRCKSVIDVGGYYCHCSLEYVQWEASHCIPHPWFLPDLHMTEQIRIGRIDIASNLQTERAMKTFSSRCETARRQLLEPSAEFKKGFDVEHAGLAEEVRRLPPSEKYERLREAFASIDKTDQHKMALCLIPQNWIKDETRFCLSPEWMTWQYMRLISTMQGEYTYLRLRGSAPDAKHTERDYQDMEYVLLLSRADAIITRDKKLVEPLAREAFPDKDVFSSLDEVTEDYICNWTQ
jgi:hypothetical protein